MPQWKSCLGLLLTSLSIVTGTYLFEKSASHVMDSLPLHLESSKILTAMPVIIFTGFTFFRSTYLKTWPLNGYLSRHKEHVGTSIVISSCAFTIRSFYLSFYDFETSLTSLYVAFGFMLLSIIVIYGKTGVPSSTVVISASHVSLVLAFLGLAIMITPNMMNIAFVVASTATFSLVISVVLFLMNTTRTDSIVDGLLYNDGTRIMNSTEILEHLQHIDETVKEVFADEDRQEYSDDNLDKSDKFFDTNNESKKQSSDENYATSKVNKLSNQDEDIESITEAIIDDLTEQAKSMNSCVNYLISNVNQRSTLVS